MPSAMLSGNGTMTELVEATECQIPLGDGKNGNGKSTRARRAIRRGLERLTIHIDSDDVWQDIGPIPQTPRSPTAPVSNLVKLMDRTLDSAAQSYPMIEAVLSLFLSAAYMGPQCVRWFRFGATATWFALRLFTFAMLLLPVFLRMVWWYFRDPRITRRVRFGPNARNYIDVYSPPEAQAAIEGRGPKVPVVIAVMGGAWIIGHRAWNLQLGLRLAEAGILVFAVEYRNFPIGGVPEMTEDLSRGIGWIFKNVEAYGGDPDNIALIGQSAGAHLSALLVMEHALMEARHNAADCEKTRRDWSTSRLKGCVLVSGPYDLVALESHLDSRGLYSRILHHFCVNGDVVGCSPARLLETPEWKAVQDKTAALMPPLTLFHGKADKSVPYWSTLKFAEDLKASGVQQVTTDIRENVAHAEIVVEGPIRGEEFQLEPLFPYLFGDGAKERLNSLPPLRPMFPRAIVDLASVIMPF
eukprot:TRINITY_DN18174_c0_g1_i1.p1 TRINITY_DN18174_c0_g1~~TRINITY_DN18174_c0_g1_i1.p1  ORF type:complete len:469 (+),score=67.94 TRINITY_DN18174_c0_g1_i1:56-1462(+)